MNDDDCPICKAPEPTPYDRLFDALDACLTGHKLDPYENLGELKMGGTLDLRKLVELRSDDRVTKPTG